MDAKNYEPTDQIRKAMIENELRQLCANITMMGVTARVAKKCGDSELLKKTEENMVRLERFKDAYLEELNSIG